MTTNTLNTCLTIGHPSRLFFVFFFAVCSLSLFAQSDKAFQIEAGMEHFIAPKSRSYAAAGGLFLAGKYQMGQFETGLKAGLALWQYGSDRPGFPVRYSGGGFFGQYEPIRVVLTEAYFEDMDYYAEAFFNYKPRFRHIKPFFGLGMRLIKRGNRRTEIISPTQHTVQDGATSPTYFTPVFSAGYYHGDIKYQISYCFQQQAGTQGDISPSRVRYQGFYTVGASYVFGIGKQEEEPSSEELPFSFFRPLLVRLEGGLSHQISLSEFGVGSALRSSLELTVRITKKLRVGIRTDRPFKGTVQPKLGIDSKSLEYYFNSDGVVYSRSVNTGERISSHLLIAEYIVKSTHNKDVLILGGGLGVYTIEGTGLNSYKDNGITIELPPLLKDATVPGIYLRVGQRFGAFSHSAFVNVMPGQVPVTFGIQAGLGLNIFGKKRTGEE